MVRFTVSINNKQPPGSASWINQRSFTGYCRMMGASEEQVQAFCRSGVMRFTCVTPGPGNREILTRYVYRLD